jgi:anti-sigma-K factor RskA
MAYAENEPWWKPRYWRKRTWAVVATSIVVILVIVIAVPVQIAKNNRYPNYSKLNYALADECEFIRQRLF